MRHHFKSFLLVALLATGAACDTGRHSAAGFRLPAAGDANQGKADFATLGCTNCHTVSGAELPAPTGRITTPVNLGGELSFEMNDGYLVTAIINPSHTILKHSKQYMNTAGASLMPAYAQDLTVKQLTDIVAFLQAHYATRTLPSRYSSYY